MKRNPRKRKMRLIRNPRVSPTYYLERVAEEDARAQMFEAVARYATQLAAIARRNRKQAQRDAVAWRRRLSRRTAEREARRGLN